MGLCFVQKLLAFPSVCGSVLCPEAIGVSICLWVCALSRSYWCFHLSVGLCFVQKLLAFPSVCVSGLCPEAIFFALFVILLLVVTVSVGKGKSRGG